MRNAQLGLDVLSPDSTLSTNCFRACPGGEIGRRATLRSLWGQPLAGSTPVLGTFLTLLHRSTIRHHSVSPTNGLVVSVTSLNHPAGLGESQLLKQCTVQLQRRSGPGGQHRNKVETAVVINHTPSGLRAEASERRSQADNRRTAIFRLRLVLAVHLRCPIGPLVDACPSPLWTSRCRGTRISISPQHEDFPIVLAELLDVLAAVDGDFGRAAEFFSVTASQLVALLRDHPPALTLVNQQRLALGWHTLK